MNTIPSRPRRRWLRRVLLVLVIFVGLPAAYYFYTTWSLKADIARAIAETDAVDPRWRFDDMEADRAVVPDAENSALQIIKVSRLLGRGAGNTPTSHKDYDAIFNELPATAELNVQQIQLIREVFDKNPEALAEARKLKDMPRGRFAITWDPSGVSALLPDHQKVRVMAVLLQHDAMLRAQFGDPDAALDSCEALSNAGYSLSHDQFAASLVMRNANNWLFVESLERVIAQGTPKSESLRRLQQCAHRERDGLRAQWLAAVRGERASFHRFYEPLILGKTTWMQMAENLHIRVHLQDYLAHYFPAEIVRDFPQHLRHRNEQVATAQLPLDKQLEQFRMLEQKVDHNDQRRVKLAAVLPLLPFDYSVLCRSHLRTQARIGAAEAGLACERFRLAHQRWPQSLAEVVKAKLLDAAPIDPFVGEPLRFARLKDGVVIYSVGEDKQDHGGDLRRDAQLTSATNIGFQLWDPPQRRQPPRPPAALEQ